MGREDIDRAFEQQRELEKSNPWMKHITFIILGLAGYGLWTLILTIANTLN